MNAWHLVVIYFLIGGFIAGLELQSLKEESEEHYAAGSILIILIWPLFTALAIGIRVSKLYRRVAGWVKRR